MNIVFALALAMAPRPSDGFELNYAPSFDSFSRFSVYDFMLEPAQKKILVNDDTSIYGFDLDGTLSFQLTIDDGWIVASFGFVPSHRVYAVCINKRGEERWEFRFFDEEGGYLGPGYNKVGSNELYYRQIIACADKVFLNKYDYKHINSDNTPILQEAKLEPYQDGFVFQLVGDAFSTQLVESRGFGANFKKRWLVPDQNNLYVVDQLQPRAWVFNTDGGRSQYKRDKHRPISLSKSTSYFEFFAGEDSQENRQKWFHSFTKVTGFYRFGDGFLISYTRPNREHAWYAFEPEEVKTGAAPFVLCLQRVDQNFEQVGENVEWSGAHMIGAQGKTAYIAVPGRENQFSLINKPGVAASANVVRVELITTKDF